MGKIPSNVFASSSKSFGSSSSMTISQNQQQNYNSHSGPHTACLSPPTANIHNHGHNLRSFLIPPLVKSSLLSRLQATETGSHNILAENYQDEPLQRKRLIRSDSRFDFRKWFSRKKQDVPLIDEPRSPRRSVSSTSHQSIIPRNSQCSKRSWSLHSISTIGITSFCNVDAEASSKYERSEKCSEAKFVNKEPKKSLFNFLLPRRQPTSAPTDNTAPPFTASPFTHTLVLEQARRALERLRERQREERTVPIHDQHQTVTLTPMTIAPFSRAEIDNDDRSPERDSLPANRRRFSMYFGKSVKTVDDFGRHSSTKVEHTPPGFRGQANSSCISGFCEAVVNAPLEFEKSVALDPKDLEHSYEGNLTTKRRENRKRDAYQKRRQSTGSYVVHHWNEVYAKNLMKRASWVLEGGFSAVNEDNRVEPLDIRTSISDECEYHSMKKNEHPKASKRISRVVPEIEAESMHINALKAAFEQQTIGSQLPGLRGYHTNPRSSLCTLSPTNNSTLTRTARPRPRTICLA